jgi:hypothetical protein
VLDDASFPIIGEGTTEPNDNFITQLDNGRLQLMLLTWGILIEKVAVGGHSYGAFMVANVDTLKSFACGM